MDGLGIHEGLLQTHIAWDIGAGPLSLNLASGLNGAAFLCTTSRLVLDVNRHPDAKDIIPLTTDNIEIAGNQNLNPEQHQRRIADFHTSYHAALANEIDALTIASNTPFVLSIHSFTDRLMGSHETRPWEVGVLWRHDEPSARSFMELLAGARPDWTIGDNEPYSAFDLNYTADYHLAPRGLRHLALEIRQDLIGDKDGITTIAEILLPIIKQVASENR